MDATINAFEKNLYNNDIVNIGNDKEFTILQLAELIKEITGSSSKIVHRDPLAEGDMTRRQPDVSRMKTLLGRDFTEIRKGLERVINHFEKKKVNHK